jgi:two-component system, cell cycle sensor histidine kinase PleC
MTSSEVPDDPQALRTTIERLTRELDDRKDLEARLGSMLEQLEAANRAKSEFLAQMSHELRTPLNAIIGFSEIMIAGIFGPLSPRYAGYMRDIQTSGQLLLEMIDQVLDLSRIESGNAAPAEEVVDLRSVLETGVRLLEPRLRDKQIELQVALTSALPKLRADPRMLKQVVLNLLSNAVKFTPEGGQVELHAVCDGEGVVLTVADSGVGIPANEIAKVFEPFRRASNAVRGGIPGTGLGLSITRHLVELHGGRIVIESQLGQGTRARVTLPGERVVE